MDITTKRGRLCESVSVSEQARGTKRRRREQRSRLAETTASPWELFPLREACTEAEGRRRQATTAATAAASTRSTRPAGMAPAPLHIWAAERSPLVLIDREGTLCATGPSFQHQFAKEVRDRQDSLPVIKPEDFIK